MTGRAPRGYILLWLITLVSLGFNILLVVGGVYALQIYRDLAGQAAGQVSAASAEVDANRMTNFNIPVVVDEVIPVNFVVEYNDTFEVPIDTSIPVRTSVEYRETFQFPINETLTIDTDFDVEIDIPFTNRTVPINVPINTDVPVNLEVEVPIEIVIPVETDVPIKLTVDIPIDTEIPIDEEIPVQFDIPVTVPIEDTTIPSIFDQIVTALDGLALVLAEETERFKEWVP